LQQRPLWNKANIFKVFFLELKNFNELLLNRQNHTREIAATFLDQFKPLISKERPEMTLKMLLYYDNALSHAM